LGEGDTGDVVDGVGGLHVMNSSHELHVMNSSHEWHVMNSSHEKAEGLEEKEESERRGEAARQDGGGIRLVEATPCRSWSR